jgi:hypothetical protein
MTAEECGGGGRARASWLPLPEMATDDPFCSTCEDVDLTCPDCYPHEFEEYVEVEVGPVSPTSIWLYQGGGGTSTPPKATL